MQRLENVAKLFLSRNQQTFRKVGSVDETSAKRGGERNEKKARTFLFTLPSSCTIALRFDPVFDSSATASLLSLVNGEHSSSSKSHQVHFFGAIDSSTLLQPCDQSVHQSLQHVTVFLASGLASVLVS
jgi:hypothetical protein